jgi:hypothetical protein
MHYEMQVVTGHMDEFRVWDVARDISQVNAMRDTTMNGDEANLALYFPMNEGSGFDLFDEGPRLTHGELHVDIEHPKAAEYVHSDAPLKRVNRFSTQACTLLNHTAFLNNY